MSGIRPPDGTIARVGGACAIAGPACFIAVVFALQRAQPGYDPVTQLMSELALGPQGQWMLAAFLGLAVAWTGLAVALSAMGAPRGLSATAFAAGTAFAGAGFFPLGASFDAHIPLVGAAFVLSGLVMLLGPARVTTSRRIWWASWLVALGLVAAVVLGQALLPMGVAQRIAAGCLLLWLMACGLWVLRARIVFAR